MGFSSICCFAAIEKNAISCNLICEKALFSSFTGVINCPLLIGQKPCARLTMSSQSNNVREWKKMSVCTGHVFPSKDKLFGLLCSQWDDHFFLENFDGTTLFAPWALFYLFNGFFTVFISPPFSLCLDSVGVCSVVPGLLLL